MKQIITIGYLNKTLWGGHIQPREQDFVISEEGISMSLPASYNLHCFKIMEIVKYEQADKDRQPVRREQRDRLRREHLGYRGNLTCPDDNGVGNREPIIVEIVRYAESSHGKESTLILGADSNGTHPQPSAYQALKTCQKH